MRCPSDLALLACCLVVFLRRAEAQAMMLESQAPPGLRAWLGKDLCGTPRWVQFHSGMAEVIGHFNARAFAPALSGLSSMLSPIVSDPYVAFDCGTAVASALLLSAQACDQLNLPILAARFRQSSALFSSFDFQMKGQDYIDGSPWPIRWTEAMDSILRSMTYVKQHESASQPWWNLPLRTGLSEKLSAERRSSLPRQRVAIVSVCDYDPAATPLARLSQINKNRYAQKFGYDVIIHEKSLVFEDPLASLFVEPLSHRPPAWSKIDSILRLLAAGEHDWIYWMDCDSFFMDGETRLEEVTALAEPLAGDCEVSTDDDNKRLGILVQKWMEGPSQDIASDRETLLRWYDDLLDQSRAAELSKQGSCGNPAQLGSRPPENRTLGWSEWLFTENRKHLIASEDGLMLNTGNVLVRSSTWSWQFFQKVRWMTFGRSPVTQHPWWEQTAMVYLLQLPFTLAQATALSDSQQPSHTPACVMLSQKHLNSYPPLVASALLTHQVFEVGDFIVSFSGCKIYSSQEVCNQLFLSHFAYAHGMQELEADPALQSWL